MRITKSKSLTLAQKQELFELWNMEYPVNLQYKHVSELEDYLSKLEDQNHILLIDEKDKIKGWYCDFLRDNARWFLTMLNTEMQGIKFGTQFMELAKEGNNELNGWVINTNNYFKSNGEVYPSPIEFYRKNGFKILDNSELKTDKIRAIKVQWSKTDNNKGSSPMDASN